MQIISPHHLPKWTRSSDPLATVQDLGRTQAQPLRPANTVSNTNQHMPRPCRGNAVDSQPPPCPAWASRGSLWHFRSALSLDLAPDTLPHAPGPLRRPLRLAALVRNFRSCRLGPHVLTLDLCQNHPAWAGSGLRDGASKPCVPPQCGK